MTNRIKSATWGDPTESLAAIWSAFELVPDGTFSEEETDDINTAMAWLGEFIEDVKEIAA